MFLIAESMFPSVMGAPPYLLAQQGTGMVLIDSLLPSIKQACCVSNIGPIMFEVCHSRLEDARIHALLQAGAH